MDPPLLIPPGQTSDEINTPFRNASSKPHPLGSHPSTLSHSEDNDSVYSGGTSFIEADDVRFLLLKYMHYCMH